MGGGQTVHFLRMKTMAKWGEFSPPTPVFLSGYWPVVLSKYKTRANVFRWILPCMETTYWRALSQFISCDHLDIEVFSLRFPSRFY